MTCKGDLRALSPNAGRSLCGRCGEWNPACDSPHEERRPGRSLCTACGTPPSHTRGIQAFDPAHRQEHLGRFPARYRPAPGTGAGCGARRADGKLRPVPEQGPASTSPHVPHQTPRSKKAPLPCSPLTAEAKGNAPGRQRHGTILAEKAFSREKGAFASLSKRASGITSIKNGGGGASLRRSLPFHLWPPGPSRAFLRLSESS